MIQYLPWVLIVVGIFLLGVMRLWRGAGEKMATSTVAPRSPEPPSPKPTAKSAPKAPESKSSTEKWKLAHRPEMRQRDEKRIRAHEDQHSSYHRSEPPPPSPNKPTNWVVTIITLMVLGSALYIILAPGMYPDTQQKWASGAVGTILGFWLRH
jgi:hypothetical protein